MIITVNDEVDIIVYTKRGNVKYYRVVHQDWGRNKTHYSMDDAVIDLANSLDTAVSTGDILKLSHSSKQFRVIQHDHKSLYNLQDIETDELMFICCIDYPKLKDFIDGGHYTKQ